MAVSRCCQSDVMLIGQSYCEQYACSHCKLFCDIVFPKSTEREDDNEQDD